MKHPNSVDSAFEDQDQAPQPEDTSFGDILSQFEQEHHETDAPGRSLEGTVVAVQEDLVLVDIGRKTEGVVPVAKLPRRIRKRHGQVGRQNARQRDGTER